MAITASWRVKLSLEGNVRSSSPLVRHRAKELRKPSRYSVHGRGQNGSLWLPRQVHQRQSRRQYRPGARVAGRSAAGHAQAPTRLVHVDWAHTTYVVKRLHRRRTDCGRADPGFSISNESDVCRLICEGSGRRFPPTGAIILDAPRRAAGDASGGRWLDRRTMLQPPMPRNQRSTDAGRKRSAGGIPAGRRTPQKPPMICMPPRLAP
jgi:hypothetical protein